MAFVLLCNEFKSGEALPKRYTCDGDNVSPPLWWNDPPKTAVSYTLMLLDLDAPTGSPTHWVLFDLPGMTRRLSTGVPAIEMLPQLGRARQAKNDAAGKVGYSGPCPTGGATHHYAFRLFALDRVLSLGTPTQKASDVKKAMQGHVVGSVDLATIVVRK